MSGTAPLNPITKITFENRRRIQPAISVFPPRILNIDADFSSVGYYRIVEPFYYLNRLGLAQCKTKFHFFQEGEEDSLPPEQVMERFHQGVEWANIIVCSRPHDLSTLRFMKSAKERGKTIIVDTDDRIDAIEVLEDEHLSEFWVKGERVGIFEESLDIADAVSVSSRYLKEHYSQRLPAFYMANPVDIHSSRWNFPHEKHNREGVTICWVAGISHKLDADLIAEPIARTLAIYPDSRFKILGLKPDWLADLPQDRVEHKNGGYFDQWPPFLADVDICLAPMLDHRFNWGRSDTKAFESTMGGAAVVASPIGETSYWRDGESILFARDEADWLDSLSMLIEQPELRSDLVHNALRFVIGFRSADAVIPTWYEAYKQALVGARR